MAGRGDDRERSPSASRRSPGPATPRGRRPVGGGGTALLRVQRGLLGDRLAGSRPAGRGRGRGARRRQHQQADGPLVRRGRRLRRRRRGRVGALPAGLRGDDRRRHQADRDARRRSQRRRPARGSALRRRRHAPAGHASPPSPEHDGQWQDFVARAAQEFPEALAFQIWNEPNAEDYWGGCEVDPARYLELVDLARQALGPEHDIVSAGLNPAVDAPAGVEWTSYLESLVDGGLFADGRAQFLAVHPYPRPAAAGRRRRTPAAPWSRA